VLFCNNALQVGLHLGLEFLDVTVFDSQRLGKFRIHRRQHRRLHVLDLDLEMRGLAGELPGGVLGREGQIEPLAVARLEPGQVLLEILQQTALADHRSEVLALAALEWLTIDRTLIIELEQIAFCRCPVGGLEGAALLLQHFQRLRDVGIAQVHDRATDLVRAQVADLHFRIDLKTGTESHCRGARLAGLRLEARIACDLQLVGLHGLAKTGLQRFAQHFLPHTGSMLARHGGERCLAGTETGHLDVAGQALEAALHFVFQLVHGHVDIQAPGQAFENFKICLHQNTSWLN